MTVMPAKFQLVHTVACCKPTGLL